MDGKKWKAAAIIALGAVLVTGVIGVTRVRSERKIESLLHEADHAAKMVPPSPQEVIAYLQGERQFNTIWAAHTQRDVTPEIVPFLEHASPRLQKRAVRALGRLQNPAAKAPLRKLLEKKTVAPILVKMALARIDSRQLKGKARIAAVAKSAGLSFGEVVRLSQKVNGVRSYSAGRSTGDEIVMEMVDLLYTMADHGEAIQPLAKQLTLTQPQQVELQAAALPLDQEIKMILDYASHFADALTSDVYDLTVYHLVSLGPRSAQLLIQRLEDMKNHPEQYRMHRCYALIFRAAAETGDSRMIPLLKQFENNADPEVRQEADQARRRIEDETALLASAPTSP